MQLFDEVLGVSFFIDTRFIGLLALHPLHLQFCSNAFVPCPFVIADISITIIALATYRNILRVLRIFLAYFDLKLCKRVVSRPVHKLTSKACT